MNLDNKQNEIFVYFISFCLLSKFIKIKTKQSEKLLAVILDLA